MAASRAGTAALTPDCASLRLSPSAAAIRPTMSGVRNCITYETRLVDMATSKSVVRVPRFEVLKFKTVSEIERAFAVPVPVPTACSRDLTQHGRGGLWASCPAGKVKELRVEGCSCSPKSWVGDWDGRASTQRRPEMARGHVLALAPKRVRRSSFLG